MRQHLGVTSQHLPDQEAKLAKKGRDFYENPGYEQGQKNGDLSAGLGAEQPARHSPIPWKQASTHMTELETGKCKLQPYTKCSGLGPEAAHLSQGCQ